MDRLAMIHRAAEELAAGAALPDAELAKRLVRARDARYWQGLIPNLHADAGGYMGDGPGEAALQRAARHYQQERYCEVPAVLSPRALAALNRAIDAVIAAGWPAVFAVVADAFWHCARMPALATILSSRFPAGYAQVPHVWIHVVAPVDGASGWTPHFDGFRSNRATAWLALTDATTANGCMYLVPPAALPASFQTKDLDTRVPMSDVLKAMHGARALPVPAGSALAWDFDVFHWGGRTGSPEAARRAMSMVFVGAAEAPQPDESPLIEVSAPLPSFDLRLEVIARALEAYGRREPLARRYLPLAAQLRR